MSLSPKPVLLKVLKTFCVLRNYDFEQIHIIMLMLYYCMYMFVLLPYIL